VWPECFIKCLQLFPDLGDFVFTFTYISKLQMICKCACVCYLYACIKFHMGGIFLRVEANVKLPHMCDEWKQSNEPLRRKGLHLVKKSYFIWLPSTEFIFSILKLMHLIQMPHLVTQNVYAIISFYFLIVLEIELKVSCLLGKWFYHLGHIPSLIIPVT
jgi:hypothetical protein